MLLVSAWVNDILHRYLEFRRFLEGFGVDLSDEGFASVITRYDPGNQGCVSQKWLTELLLGGEDDCGVGG